LPYSVDLPRAQTVLREVASDEPACLSEPEPIVLCLEFSESGIRVLLGVWHRKSDFLVVKNRICAAVLARLREEGIRIPTGPRILDTAGPLSIQIVNSENEDRSTDDAHAPDL
jgi:small-conductance mechanosensitive channel